jgi:hypothetical protein
VTFGLAPGAFLRCGETGAREGFGLNCPGRFLVSNPMIASRRAVSLSSWPSALVRAALPSLSPASLACSLLICWLTLSSWGCSIGLRAVAV